MLARQRRQKILDRVNRAGAVRVSELARSLRVAEETIRRDLQTLGREQKLIRTHGGALPLAEDRQEVPFAVRRTAHPEEKKRIGQAAARHVCDGDVIALDSSSTAYCLAQALPNRPLTVITNSLEVVTCLLDRGQIQVVLPGGILDPASQSFVGSFAEESLARFHIGKFFLSSKGVDFERGLSEASDAQARLKRRMMELADATILLVDHSKFGVKSVVFFTALDEVDLLITDAGVEPATVEVLERRGVPLEVAR